MLKKTRSLYDISKDLEPFCGVAALILGKELADSEGSLTTIAHRQDGDIYAGPGCCAENVGNYAREHVFGWATIVSRCQPCRSWQPLNFLIMKSLFILLDRT